MLLVKNIKKKNRINFFLFCSSLFREKKMIFAIRNSCITTTQDRFAIVAEYIKNTHTHIYIHKQLESHHHHHHYSLLFMYMLQLLHNNDSIMNRFVPFFIFYVVISLLFSSCSFFSLSK